MMDPFDLLGLKRTYDLDRADVQRAYLQRTTAVGGGADAAALNEAKGLLDDPERRAETLLRLLGGPAKEQDRTLPPGFLQEMLEVREAIERERTADRALPPARLEHWERWAEARRSGHAARVSGLFNQLTTLGGQSSPDASRRLVEIRQELNAWRYAERLIDQLEPPTIA